MKKLTVYMQERVFYSLIVEVPDDVTENDIEALAEEQFVQGDYRVDGCDDRKVTGWKDR